MTDLVAQLVRALEECLDDSRQVLADMEQIYSDRYRPWRLVSQRKTIADAEAALSAAKGGWWLPIETAPRGSGIDGPDSVTHPDYVDPPKLLLWTEEGPLVGYYDWYYHPGYGRGAEDGESAWRDHSGARTYGASAWQPLPNPPKEQNT